MLESLTIKEVKEVLNLFQGIDKINVCENKIDNYWVGKKVIVRTYSAGVHFGEIELKSNDEVILKNARRLCFWKTLNKGISLSEVANMGLHKDSRVCQAVDKIYLKAIELILCKKEAITNIEDQDDYTA